MLEVRPTEGLLSGVRYRPFKGFNVLPVDELKKVAKASACRKLDEYKVVYFLFEGRLAAAADLKHKLYDKAVGNKDRARQLSDLSAIYLTRASLEREPLFYFRALTYSATATREDPAFARAWFNLSLSSEALFLRATARRAWKNFVDRNHGIVPQEEVRAHLARLSLPRPAELWPASQLALEKAIERNDRSTAAQLIKRFPQFAREFSSEDLLGQWGDARLSGRISESMSRLNQAAVIGDILYSYTGDESVAAAVSAIKSASTSNLKQLAAGHSAFLAGRRAYDRYDINSAAVAFSEASVNFAAGYSSFKGWADFFLAACKYQRGAYLATLKALDDIESRKDVVNKPTLLGRVHWVKGLIHLHNGQIGGSLREYRVALSSLSRAREEGNMGAVRQMLSENLDLLGEDDELWFQLYIALKSSRLIIEGRRLHAIFQGAATVQLARGEPSSALLFQDEAVMAALDGGQAEGIAAALALRASMHLALKDWRHAQADIYQATSYSEAIKESDVKAQVQADVDLIRGELEVREDPKAAIAVLSNSLLSYQAANYHYYTARLLLLRAQAQEALGDFNAARRDLLHGIQVLEDQRLLASALDMGSFDRVLDLYEELIRLNARRMDDGSSSLIAAEMARQSFFRSGGRGFEQATNTLLQLDKLLPARTAVVEFSVYKNQIITWVRSKEWNSVRRVGANSGSLERKIDDLREEAARPAGERRVHELSEEIYGLLISPIEAKIKGHSLVIIPDKELYSLPFALLRSPQTKKYLIEEHEIVVAPSISIYLGSLSESLRIGSPGSTSILAIGNPYHDRRLFPSLGRLGRSEAEAKAIGELFKNAKVLTGRDASIPAVTSAARFSEILHFGGHALVNSRYPDRSALVFAMGSDVAEPGLLFAREIKKGVLGKQRLVVLAACNTLDDGDVVSKSFESLAFSFLRSGVPNLVGSLWSIRDGFASSILGDFYSRLAMGEKVAVALRQSQLRAIEESRADGEVNFDWAAFEVFGGG